MKAHLKKTVAMLGIAGALVGGTSAYAATTGSSTTTAPDDDGDDPVVDHGHPLDGHDHDAVDDHPLHDGAGHGQRALGRRLPWHVAVSLGAGRPLVQRGPPRCGSRRA